jgi:hypothetical protein
MTESNVTDGQVNQQVKAKWLAIGLSQADLAEVLGLAFEKDQKDGKGPGSVDAGRLKQVAEALDLPLHVVQSLAVATRPQAPDASSAETLGSLQSLLGLRLLRAFHELRDHRTKRMLIHLAEQLVENQADRRGNAG